MEPNRNDEIRMTRLSGSTAGGYLGYSPWNNPLDEWEYAMGIREFRGNDDTLAGEKLEEAIGRWTADELGLDFDRAIQPGTIVHREHPDVFCCTPDYFWPDEGVGIQCKNHAVWARKRYKGEPQTQGRWDNALIPTEKLIQCLVEYDVVRTHYPNVQDMWFLASLFGGNRLKIYWIRRDTRTIDSLIRIGTKFWRRHLNPEGPLDPPSSECDCGGCGRGGKWWVGPYKKPQEIKLTTKEIAASPIPFSEAGEGSLPFVPPFMEE